MAIVGTIGWHTPEATASAMHEGEKPWAYVPGIDVQGATTQEAPIPQASPHCSQ